ARIQRDHDQLVALFAEMATGANAGVTRLASTAEVPQAVADLLARENLPAQVVASPALQALPWSERPVLEVRFGRAEGSDHASVTPAFAAIAETGTLMLVSGADT